MTLEELDKAQLRTMSADVFTLPALRTLLRRRSAPTLWFTWRKLPALYARGRTARYDQSVTRLLVRVLMYSTGHDHHSSLEDLCHLIDRESLERFAHALLTQWLSGPRTRKMSWALHSQRVIGGLNSLMVISESLFARLPERDLEIQDMLDVFWQHELLGPSFLHLFEHHPEERVSMLVRALLEQSHEREMWHTASPARIDETLQRIGSELRVMELSGGVREIFVEGTPIELRMTDSGWLESRAPDHTRYRVFAEQALAGTRAHREVWLLVDMFRHIALQWRAMVHAANEQQHQWSQARWRELFFSAQVVSHWSRGLIWTEYNEEDRILGTFRVTEDASLTDVEDEVYQLAEHSQIGLAHASLIESHVMDDWGEHLADYEIIAPTSQFSQRVCDAWSREELEDFILEGCTARRVELGALDHNLWRLFDTGYYRYRRKKIFAGARRLFLGLEIDAYTRHVSRFSVVDGMSRIFLASQVRPSTMNLQDLDDMELRVVVEHLLAVLE